MNGYDQALRQPVATYDAEHIRYVRKGYRNDGDTNLDLWCAEQQQDTPLNRTCMGH